MTTVTEDLDLPGGGSPKQVVVSVFLAGEGGDPLPAGYATADGVTVVGRHQLRPDDDGTWEIDLVPNDEITPAGTVWGIVLSGSGAKVDRTARFIEVPDSGGPYTVEELLVDPPGAIATAQLQAEIERATAAEEALGDGIDAESAARAAADLDARLDALSLPRAGDVTQGLYARSRPTPNNGNPIRPLAKDPNQLGVNGTGRLWGIGSQFAQIGYTDDDGATFVVKASPLIAGASVQQIKFSNSYMWLLVADPTTSRSGTLWRIPIPDANGMPTGIGSGAASNVWNTTLAAGSNGQSLPQATINIINGNYFNAGGGTVTVMTSAGPQIVTYTGKTAGTLTGCSGGTGTMSTGGIVTNALCVQNLSGKALGPAGAATDGGVNSTYRNSCFDIAPDESFAALIEYGGANATATIAALTDGRMAQYGTFLTSAAGVASSSHIGLAITVAGAGAGGADLSTTITRIVRSSSPAIFEVSQPALTAVGAATVTFPSATYGAGVIVQGPKAYYSTNPGAAAGSVLWAVAKTFNQGKHGHCIKVRNGAMHAAVGDLGGPYPDCGIWTASTAAPTVWSQRSVSPTGSIPKDPINMLPVTIDGVEVWLGESDSSLRDGPLVHRDTTATRSATTEASCKIPPPRVQTMRSLTLVADEAVMWVGTGEAGAVGPITSVWISAKPYIVPVLLEDVGTDFDAQTLGDPIYSNGFVWFGTYRCVAERFKT